jgi:hypothetical protein
MPDLDTGGTGPDRAEGGAVTGGWKPTLAAWCGQDWSTRIERLTNA